MGNGAQVSSHTQRERPSEHTKKGNEKKLKKMNDLASHFPEGAKCAMVNRVGGGSEEGVEGKDVA